RALFTQARADDAQVFVRTTLGPLLDHDRERGRGGDLAATVAVYLANAQHHARTRSALHIHANALYQRINRADDLLGEGWRNADRALDIQNSPCVCTAWRAGRPDGDLGSGTC
ncbi:MAG: helix-turn-helix domain-containing protein, partial [Streptomyces sp.]